ncbi:hypothetical protein BQ8482_70055 [Mesorhizobium delmotii]|uniref:Uncharacterized protein n=1 Tax=Mesorhizobium delmotii TaxID=1631247 RepID=A0A2P9AW41_9HYPH|nr:hypothetical protein BQ8482_70055 [Mesorhizobium delmotii]
MEPDGQRGLLRRRRRRRHRQCAGNHAVDHRLGAAAVSWRPTSPLRGGRTAGPGGVAAAVLDVLFPSAHLADDPTPGLRPDPPLKEEGDVALTARLSH